MLKPTGWIIQAGPSIRGGPLFHGPFSSASEAGQYLEKHHEYMAGGFTLAPLCLRQPDNQSILDTTEQSTGSIGASQ